jgi:hypothetical protein
LASERRPLEFRAAPPKPNMHSAPHAKGIWHMRTSSRTLAHICTAEKWQFSADNII